MLVKQALLPAYSDLILISQRCDERGRHLMRCSSDLSMGVKNNRFFTPALLVLGLSSH